MVVAALAGVGAGVGVFVAVAMWSGSADIDLGDDVFEAGRAAALAESIDAGGPLLFSDVGGGERDIYVNHVGRTPARGWVAFPARPPGSGRECFLRWDGGRFEDSCSDATYPADGGALPHYRVVVTDGRVKVDLRSPASP
jgi:hypothetical protein